VKFEINFRMDGRVELCCEHGVGHPSKSLQNAHRKRKYEEHDGIHGCDGCCGHEDFAKTEQKILDQIEKQKKKNGKKKG
jgi:hypothetical protein